MADDNGVLAPEIRFKGYNDAWECRKLGGIAPLQRGFDLPKSEMKEGVYPVVMSNGINGFHSQFKARAPGVVTGRSGTIGNLHYIETDYWPHNTTLWVTDFKGNHPKYIYHLYDKIDLSQFGTGTGVPTLNRNDVHDETVYIPCFEEQIKISVFLNTIDTTITLCKRKLDGLKELKSGYLQQMFPQAGEYVPRIRFAGFSEPWEERKLGEVVERVTRKNKDLQSTLPLTISAQYGLIAQQEFFDKEVASKDVSNYYLLKNGDFAYNKSYSNGYPWGAVKRLDKYDMGVLSTLYIVFAPINVDSEFLVQYYETTYWHNEVAQYAAEGARNHGLLNIPTSDFFETILMVPTDSAEQTAIRNFFRNFDEQIAVWQTKLYKLKQLKSAYLQKMFI